MKTYNIYIQGVVQGVGFRPFVYKLAMAKYVGWVNNSIDGVHIQINCQNRKDVDLFLDEVIENAPAQSQITHFEVKEVDFEAFSQFSIVESNNIGKPNLLITPDFGICEACRFELMDNNNRRFEYPFNTCTNCGPRFSIIHKLPYDRPTTSMCSFKMCSKCQNEYDNPLDRRYFSQTNSCPDCSIKISLFKNAELVKDDFTDLDQIVKYWEEGKIIAIKSIGGFLLTCDATKPDVINRLRSFKNRPTKPFALVYPDINVLEKDVLLSDIERRELTSVVKPIVLLKLKNDIKSKIAISEIAPNLNQIGVMLPSTALLEILSFKFKKPIVATSGNPSNSTIVYQNDNAIDSISQISDYMVVDNRDIVIPQDDSIVRFTAVHKQKIILRRSRGLAPSYFNSDLVLDNKTVLSMGSMMKSSFTLLHNQNIFVSQYLGNTIHFEAENNYRNVLNHFNQLLQPEYDVILRDKHPNYFSSQLGNALSEKYDIPLYQIQHHKAHFYSVLAENDLLNPRNRVLGVVWDGIGLGNDGNIWGGEFFDFSEGKVKRIDHLKYFDFFLGDKMSKEPRISALALVHNMPEMSEYLKDKFSDKEWKIYAVLLKNNHLKTSSVGRLFDAVSSIVLGNDIQSYEGEAAILLENAASIYFNENGMTLNDSYFENVIPNDFYEYLITKILADLESGVEKHFIAAKFHVTMAHYIAIFAKKNNNTKVAFSGGVFQNSCLIDLIVEFMGKDYTLFFNKNLSPNDENISFGQLMAYLQKDLI